VLSFDAVSRLGICRICLCIVQATEIGKFGTGSNLNLGKEDL